MQHEDGVYFGMSEADYFADADALGSTDLKTLARSPADWWWYTPHNPMKPDETTNPGKQFGSALHKALLEGVAAYDAEYFVMPEAPENSVKTMEQMRDLLDLNEIGYKKSIRKDDLADLVIEHFPDTVIFDRWLAERRAEIGGRQEISDQWDAAIRIMRRVIDNHPQLKDAFVGGMPEVSVFWTEGDIRFRARFDYLKPQGLFDLKSISNWRGDDFRKACLKEVANRGYDIQAPHYMDARDKAVSLMREGRVFGDVDPAFPKEILKAKDYAFVFVFMQTIGSPRALPLVFPRSNIVAEVGQRIKAQALSNYRAYRDRFGLAQMWVEIDELWSPSLDDWAQANFWRYGS